MICAFTHVSCSQIASTPYLSSNSFNFFEITRRGVARKKRVIAKTCLKFNDKEQVSIDRTAPKKGDVRAGEGYTGRGKLSTSHRTENDEMFANTLKLSNA